MKYCELYGSLRSGEGEKVSTEEIEKAVKEYLKQNPIEPGATEEQIKQIESKAPAILLSTSGSTVTVTDSADLSLHGLKLYGKSSQVKTTGAQLFDASKLPTKSASGATVTNNGDGSFTISGSGNLTQAFQQKYEYNHTDTLKLLKAGTVKLKADSSEPYIAIAFYKNDSVLAEINTISSMQKYTLEKEMLNDESFHMLIQFYGRKGNAIKTGNIKPMLYQDGDGTWEPFSGGIPAPNPEYPQEIDLPGSDGEIEMGVRGKNLYDMSALKYINYSNGIAYIQNQDAVELPYSPAAETYGVGVVVPCKAGVTYTMSIRNPNPNAVVIIAEYADSEAATSSGNKIGFADAKAESVVYQAKGNGVLLCAVAGKWTDGSTSLHTCTEDEQIQVELGNEATSYEPYKRIQILTFSTSNGFPGIPVDSDGNYTDNAGQQWVCDEIDLERGKYIQRIAIESISGGWKMKETKDSPGRYLQDNVLKNTFRRGNIKALCNIAIWTSWGSAKERYNTFAINNRAVYLRPPEDTTAEQFSEKLNSLETPVVFIGQLEKPIERDLTQEEIAAYRSLHTNYPTTVVTTDTVPQAGIEMEYVADTDRYLSANYVSREKYEALEERVSALEHSAVEEI